MTMTMTMTMMMMMMVMDDDDDDDDGGGGYDDDIRIVVIIIIISIIIIIIIMIIFISIIILIIIIVLFPMLSVSARPIHVVGIHTSRNPSGREMWELPCLGESDPFKVGICLGRTPKSPDSLRLGRSAFLTHARPRCFLCAILLRIHLFVGHSHLRPWSGSHRLRGQVQSSFQIALSQKCLVWASFHFYFSARRSLISLHIALSEKCLMRGPAV